MATQSGSTFAGKGTESDSPDGDLFSILTSGANAVTAGAQAVKRALLDPNAGGGLVVTNPPATMPPLIMEMSQQTLVFIGLGLVVLLAYMRKE